MLSRSSGQVSWCVTASSRVETGPCLSGLTGAESHWQMLCSGHQHEQAEDCCSDVSALENELSLCNLAIDAINHSSLLITDLGQFNKLSSLN